MNPTIKAIEVPTTPRSQLSTTVRLIGEGIRSASEYQPLRLHVAGLATRADRKDYLGQLERIYNDFLKRWRYVRDPLGLETVATTGPAIWGIVGGSFARPGEYGHGDCDDATAYIGAAARALGFPVRIVTMAAPGALIPSHVYPQIRIPKIGWITADPVAHPHPLGYEPPAGRRMIWNLSGQLLADSAKGGKMSSYQEYVNGLSGLADTANQGTTSAPLEMYGLAGLDQAEPLDISTTVLQGFGSYTPLLGAMDGGGIGVEVEPDTADGYALTPILELSLGDYAYLEEHGTPYEGMYAIDWDGNPYQYQIDGLGRGFFSRLKKRIKRFGRRVKKGIKKGFKAIKRVAKKIIKKIPGGKYLIKIAGKLKKVALKLVKPLAKILGGPIGKFVSKVAAFVPGIGPAIAAGLYTAGKIAKVMNKLGIKKKAGKLSFKSGDQAKRFKLELAREAKRLAAQKQKRREDQAIRGLQVARAPGLRPRRGFRVARGRMLSGTDYENEVRIPCNRCY